MCKAMEDMRYEALQEGREEGRKEAREEMALHMLKAQFALEVVAEISGLSLDKIKELESNRNV